jgi:membrane protease subunit HflC
MNRTALIAAGVLLVVIAVIAANTFYVVDQTHEAIVLRFGQPVRVVNAPGENGPGLQLKDPFLENAILFDKRIQLLDTNQEAEVLASDQRRLLVDAFLRYRISDPLQYYKTLRDDQTAQDRLDRMVTSSLREVLGTATSTDIISGRRDQLMAQAKAEVTAQAKASKLGIDVIDLRIKRADLPPANEAAIFRRMQTNRQQEAARIKAIGEQHKLEIMAEADKEVQVTLATAQEEAESTRGEGDSKRAVIFAGSFGRDPKFAAFYRSLQAYEAALGQGDTTMVLSPDSDFFKYFKNGPGK